MTSVWPTFFFVVIYHSIMHRGHVIKFSKAPGPPPVWQNVQTTCEWVKNVAWYCIANERKKSNPIQSGSNDGQVFYTIEPTNPHINLVQLNSLESFMEVLLPSPLARPLLHAQYSELKNRFRISTPTKSASSSPSSSSSPVVIARRHPSHLLPRIYSPCNRTPHTVTQAHRCWALARCRSYHYRNNLQKHNQKPCGVFAHIHTNSHCRDDDDITTHTHTHALWNCTL